MRSSTRAATAVMPSIAPATSSLRAMFAKPVPGGAISTTAAPMALQHR